jgi:hypothetical protein
MEKSQAEALALQVTALQAQLMALSPLQVGQRVVFEDADGITYHATVHALGRDRAGLAVAGLRMAGQGWLHAEPVQNLRRVCGACPDCRALNCRPGCAS